MTIMTIVINLFGGAGVGKSTQAALLFYHIKCLGHSVELINEYVKEHIWSERTDVLRSATDIKQDYIFAKQHKKQYILEGKVDYIITDSPIMLSAFYHIKDELYKPFEEYVLGCFNRFNNINLYLTRNMDLPYDENGRLQDKAGAMQIDTEMILSMEHWHLDYTNIKVGDEFIWEALQIIEGSSGRTIH